MMIMHAANTKVLSSLVAAELDNRLRFVPAVAMTGVRHTCKTLGWIAPDA